MKRAVLFAAAMLGTAATSHAGAQAYLGASVGRSDETHHTNAFTDQFLDLGFNSARSSSDTKDFGWRAFAGYGFGPYFALEAAYVDFGSFDSRTTVDPPGTFRARTDINGYELGAVGRLPLGDRFSLYARVSAFRSRVKTDYSGDGSVDVFEDGAHQRKMSTKPAFALGAGYQLTPHVATRVEWARYRDFGDTLTGGRLDMNLFTAGVSYVF